MSIRLPRGIRPACRCKGRYRKRTCFPGGGRLRRGVCSSWGRGFLQGLSTAQESRDWLSAHLPASSENEPHQPLAKNCAWLQTYELKI